MGLAERYFGTAKERVLGVFQRRQQEAFQRERVGEFLNVAYMVDFKKWLSKARRTAEPVPGEQHMMSYACGMRDGLQMVLDRLTVLEQQLGRHDE